VRIPFASVGDAARVRAERAFGLGVSVHDVDSAEDVVHDCHRSLTPKGVGGSPFYVKFNYLDKISFSRDVARADAVTPTPVSVSEPSVSEIEATLVASADRVASAQARLSNRVSLADYAPEKKGGTNVWTKALQKAVDEHEIVTIPASDETYWFDDTVRIPSNRRIEATGANCSLLPGTDVVLLRNQSAADGTLLPLAGRVPRDANIAVVGGRWSDWRRKRAGYGRSGRFNNETRRLGNAFGVSTLFLFNSVSNVTLKGLTFVHTCAFSVQAGEASDLHFTDTTFDHCHADGYHLNGNLQRVWVKNARGQVGDDLVALNAYDWLDSSVNFGPQRTVLCEDLELIPAEGKVYPAIRIQPAVYRYADGTEVDCAIRDVIFRRVKGIVCFKMYLQTPRYLIGNPPEWAKVGSGGNLHFEDIEIDLNRPIDMMPTYMDGDPLRGHFGAFEFGANLSSVHFKNLKVKFHADRFPLSHLVTVGPKSVVLPREGPRGCEIFDPYVSCTVGHLAVDGLKTEGIRPKELFHATVFDNINRDGRSSGRGIINGISVH